MRVSRSFRRLAIQLPLPPEAIDHRMQAAWMKRAAAEVYAQLPVGHAPLAGHVRVRIRVGLVSDPRNLPRVTVAVAELLAAEGVTSAVVSDVDAKFDRIVERGRLEVTLTETVSPAHRVPAVGRQRAGAATLARRAAELASAAA